MKGPKLNVAHYSARIAKETGLPRKLVHNTLMRITQNLCTHIQKGHDIRIKGFGRIFYRK